MPSMKEKSAQQSECRREMIKTEETMAVHNTGDGSKKSTQKTPKKSNANDSASTNATTAATKLNANGTPKRQKIVKACRDCRRRKVKCDGGTPCSTCRRSSIPCIFEASSPKKANSNSTVSTSTAAAGVAGLATTAAATKHYIESLESKINIIERALNSLGEPTMQLVEEAMRRQQLYEENRRKMTSVQQGLGLLPTADNKSRFFINEFGSPQYMQEIMSATATIGMVESQSSASPSPASVKSSSILPQPQTPVLITEVERNYIQFYFIQIQPYFPLFVPSLFNRQFQLNEIPRILIHAICMLSSFFQQTGEDELYYQKTMLMMDEAIGRPSIALVQTLLLLIKYLECSCTSKSYFFEKSKSLLGRAIDLCKILLNIHRTASAAPFLMMPTKDSSSNNDSDLDVETKKRTIAMVFTYGTLLCVEQGLKVQDVVNMMTDDNLLHNCLPAATHADESLFMDCQRCIIPFIATLSEIHQHIQRVTQRQESQKEKRTEAQVVEEQMSLLQLQVKIDNNYMSLPAQFLLGAASTVANKKKTKKQRQPIVFSYPFPVPEKEEEETQQTPEATANGSTHIVSPMTRFIHLLYHLSIILLHFHYFMYPLPSTHSNSSENGSGDNNEDHRQMCLSSASSIIRLVEYLWVNDTQHSYKYMPRGIQLLIYCLVSALSVLKVAATVSSTHKTEKESIEKESQRCTNLLQQVSARSPLQEIKSYAKDIVDTNSSSNASISSMNTSPSPTHYIKQVLPNNNNTDGTNKRRNTISSAGYYNMVPTSLLQSSSTDIYSHAYPHQHHQPLNNIHTMPLQLSYQQQQQLHPHPRPLLRRGMAQSCQDLRSVVHHGNTNSSVHAHHHRKSSVMSSSSSISASMNNYNTTRPYRQGSIGSNHSSRTVSPSLPYVKPSSMTAATAHAMMQQQQLPQAPPDPFIPVATPITIHQSKMKRVKKSTSVHSLSDVFHLQQQQQQHPQQLNYRHTMHYQPTQSAPQPPPVQNMLTSQPFNRYPSLYTQQPVTTTVTMMTPSIPATTAISANNSTVLTNEDNLLHRPYQPSLDDDINAFPLIGQNFNTNNKKFMELLYANQTGSSAGVIDTTMLDSNFNFLDSTTASTASLMMMDYEITHDTTSALLNHGDNMHNQQQQ